MSPRQTRRTRLITGLLALVVGLTAFIPDASALTLYGRSEYQNYFSGGYSAGRAWACDNQSGELICGGISALDIDSFVTFYRDHLNATGDSGSNRKVQRNRAAAFTILAMLGETGPPIGGDSGVAMAISRFSEWEKIVRAYDSAKKINYNNPDFTFATNTAYRTGVGAGDNDRGLTPVDDVQWHYVYVPGRTHIEANRTSETAPAIVFDIGSGRSVAIKRSCANMVGDQATLPPPPLDFSLTPSISTNPSDAVEAGTKITVSPVVINSGTTPSSTVTYELNSFLVAPGNDVPRINSAGYYDSKTAPCDFYIGRGVSRCDLATFTGEGVNTDTFSYPIGTHKYRPDREDVADDLAVGTKVCYAHSVKPRSHAATDEWRHSAPACITIGIKPKLQILGSDLLVGRTFMGLTAAPGNIQTSTSVRTVGSTVMTLGSWVEYGVQASGRIIGIGSGSAYAGSGLAGATICMANQLTFTNGTNSKCADNGTFGGYQANQNIPDVGSSFPITSSTASLGSNPSIGLSGLRGLYTASGNVRVNGGAINPGRWVVLNVPESTVTITDNINYTNANLNSAGDIPQVVIIAKNINIQPGVDNVDAWLIAKGSATADGIINTCATSGANDYKKLSPCDNKLTVNGPVMANKVYLRRTSNSSTGVPAEVFNLRPDAYMWAYARSVGGARVQTVYSTELPPRL